MKTKIATWLACGAIFLSTGTLSARHCNWSIGVDISTPGYYTPCYPPPYVCFPPAPVYATPVYVAQPVPVMVAPYPAVYYPPATNIGFRYWR